VDATDHSSVGTTVGRFTLERRLGAGGMGEVYTARDPDLGRLVAIKLFAAGGVEARARLAREAQIMARLAHPNVAVVYETGVHDERVFVAMELVDGVTLDAWLAERPRRWRQVLDVFLQAGRGLAAAHAAGVAHGDFEPGSVMVGRDGRVRVLDFGLARAANEPATPAADQRAFCASLRDGIAGRRGPRRLRAPLARGLSDSPGARFPDMDALLAALERAARAPRRAVIGAAAVLVAGGAAAALLLSGPERCPPAGSRLAGVWDPTRKAAMHAGFVASGAPAAEAGWQAVARVVDGYARAWARHADAICAAPHVPPARAAARRACVDQRLASLEAWAVTFSAPDRAMVASASESARALAALDCDDPSAEARPLAADPILAAKVMAVRARVDAEFARAAAGASEQGTKALAAALEEARALRFTPLVAEALLALGMAQEQRSDYQAALAAGLEGRDAAEESRYDRARVRAWILLASSYDHLERYAEAHEAARTATAIAGHETGRAGDDARGQILFAEARIADDEGRALEALELARRARALLLPLVGPDSNQIPALDLTEANILTDLHRYDEADAALERARAYYHRWAADDHPVVGKILNNLGNNAWARGDYARSADFYRRSLEVKDRAGLPRVNASRAQTLRNLGGALWGLHRFEEALAVCREARDIFAEVMGPESESVAQVLRSIGGIDTDLGRGGEGIEALEHALAIYTRLHSNAYAIGETQLLLAQALWAGGGDPARARQMAQAARIMFAANGEQETVTAIDGLLRAHPAAPDRREAR
jgi:eukaryotic-like serine/threonine-protein kinase